MSFPRILHRLTQIVRFRSVKISGNQKVIFPQIAQINADHSFQICDISGNQKVIFPQISQINADHSFQICEDQRDQREIKRKR